MKFICEKSLITNEISVAQEIISSKNALSVLSNVLLEADSNVLTIKATDLKVSFETKIPVEVNVPGSTTIFCDRFLSIIRSLPDGIIHFEQESNDKLFIFTENKAINFQLNSIAADKFPEISDISDDSYFEFPQSQFNNMVSQTIFSISDDETRYFMNGVFLEKNDKKLNMVATDGRRLSYISSESENNIPDFNSVIIPPKILSLVKKLSSGEGNLSIAVLDKTMYIKFDNQKISSTLIEGQFPNYSRVIPDSQEFKCIVNRNELISALKRVSLLAEQKSKRIYLNMSSNKILLKSEESEIGTAEEEVLCYYEGDEFRFALNFVYLMDPLKVIDSESILIEFTENNRAVTIKCEPEKDYFHIVMPMQMD